MKNSKSTRWDELLDLLADEVADRLQATRSLGPVPRPAHAPQEEPAITDAAREQAQISDGRQEVDEATDPASSLGRGSPAADDAPDVSLEAVAETPQPPGAEPDAARPEHRQVPATDEPPAAPPSPSHTTRFLGRLALALLALVVVINIPITRHGVTLATAMPDRRALVIRDGLVVKEEDDPEIYVYQDGHFRWISSLRAFEMHGYAWEDVHVVDDGFLESYQIGPPIHVILKCPESPHIYRLEGEEKRWIVDIQAFEAEGYVWEDVRFVSCSYLRGLPDGETIPPDQGPPPQP